MKISLIPLALTVLCAQCLRAAETTDEVTIGPRKSAATIKQTKVWLSRELADTAFQTEAIEVARRLGNPQIVKEERETLSTAIRADAERSANALVRCLDARRFNDVRVRQGALAGIEISQAKSKEVGKGLAGCVISEPVAQIRTSALELIKIRKDAEAANSILKLWRSSFDADGVLADNENTRTAAVTAMRDLGDKRIYSALLYYASLEVRAGTAKGVGIDTVNISGSGFNYPIEMPVLDLVSANGSIIVPAVSSLKQATGKDFGKDVGKWRDWIAAQPDFK